MGGFLPIVRSKVKPREGLSSPMAKGLSVAVAGASGFMGERLLRHLLEHPEVSDLKPLSRRFTGKRFSEVFPWSGKRGASITFGSPEKIPDADVVFYSLPDGPWWSDIPAKVESGTKVITLGGKYRIADRKVDEKYYPFPSDDGLYEERAYGLPELFRERIRKARYVANPGCYATATLLALAPLKKFLGSIDADRVVVDALSGTTGAGDPNAEPTKAAERPYVARVRSGEDMVAYSVTGHRHIPEMEWNLAEFAGEEATIHFTPHLVPLLQGIHATVTVFPKKELDEAALKEEYARAYAKEPFTRFVDSPREPVAISVKGVNGTNDCKVSLFKDKKRLLLLSVLDNLGKGGASQAVQNMNLMLGLGERLGLMPA